MKAHELHLGRLLTVQIYGRRVTAFVWASDPAPWCWKPTYWRIWRWWL